MMWAPWHIGRMSRMRRADISMAFFLVSSYRGVGEFLKDRIRHHDAGHVDDRRVDAFGAEEVTEPH